jgi:hypothetical protein
VYHVARGRTRGTPRNTLVERLVVYSTYPLDCLTYLARVNPYRPFRDWVRRLFGPDLPAAATEQLYRTLKNRPFRDPRSGDDPFPAPILMVDGHLGRHRKVSRGLFGGERMLGAYANGVIYLDDELVRAARGEAEEAVRLLGVLTEEYGHHIDHVLRNVMSSVGGDAPRDEGALFALAMWPASEDALPDLVFAYDSAGREYRLPGLPAATQWGLLFPEARIAADRGGLAESGQYREYFAAADTEVDASGKVHFRGHQGVEREVARRLGWSEATRQYVYFGNWQRDFSQFGDPKILQALAIGESKLEEWTAPIRKPLHGLWQQFHAFVNEQLAAGDGAGNALVDRVRESLQLAAPAIPPTGSKVRSAWIVPALLDVLAEDEFGPGFPVRDDPGEPYQLGVYVPREHIDNPSTITDGYAQLDDRFRGPYDHGAEGGSDSDPGSPRFGLRRYIAQSVEYIHAMITASSTVPPEMPGLTAGQVQRMFLGNALHTIEDYFAHSNFLEVTLATRPTRPWAIETYSEPVRLSGKVIHPIVTGTFGGLDTAMSIVGVLCHHLAKEEQILQPGPSKVNRLTLILLRRFSPPLAGYYAIYLDIHLLSRLPMELQKWIREGFKTVVRWIRVELAWSAAELVLELMVPRLAAMAGKGEDAQLEALKAVDSRDPDAVVEAFGRLLDLNPVDLRLARAASTLVDIDYQGDLHLHLRDPEKLAEVLEELAGLYQRVAATGTGEPTHTQLGKDHATHPLHLLATEVAIWAVEKVAEPMGRIWSQGKQVDGALVRRVLATIDSLMRHPSMLTAELHAELSAIIDQWERDEANRDRLRHLERAKADVPRIGERRKRIVGNVGVLLRQLAAAQ